MRDRTLPVLLFVLLPLVSVLFLGCASAGTPAPAQISPAVAAAKAQQTANHAVSEAEIANANAEVARANAMLEIVNATAIRQQTVDAGIARVTDAAIEFAKLSVQETAEASAQIRADVSKTENARAAATYSASQKTAVSETAEAKAVATQTARAEGEFTQTAVARVPTDLYVSALANQAERERIQRESIQAVRDQTELANAETLRMFELYLPITLWGLIGCMSAFAILLFANAGTRWLDAQTLVKAAGAVKDLVPFKDEYGRVVGYWQPINSTYQYMPVEVKEFTQPPPPPNTGARAPMLLTDGTEAAKGVIANALLAPPTPVPNPEDILVQDIIYPSDLKVFTLAILGLEPAEDDWTQKRWRDWRLPRGFVLSMDTQDSLGNVLVGGYRRLIQLYVDKHLIVNRTDTTMGEWNPNAPREIEKVLDILEGKAIPPTIPPPKYSAQTVSTSPAELPVHAPTPNVLAVRGGMPIVSGSGVVTGTHPPTPPRRRVRKAGVKVS